MIVCDPQREENFQEFIRLRNDPDYYDVIFDEKSGGVSAIHKEHQFDKTVGPFGYKRGLYERIVLTALRKHGHRIILNKEDSGLYLIKTCDGFLDGKTAEIKTIEGDGCSFAVLLIATLMLFSFAISLIAFSKYFSNLFLA